MGLISLLTADHGSQRKEKTFVAVNPTFGTDIAINADPGAIAATEAMLVLQNTASRSGVTNKNVIVVPKYIKLICTVSGASGTDFGVLLKTDTVNRYSSGGTELVGRSTYVDTTNSFARESPLAECYFGDITATAETSAVMVGQTWFRTDTAGALADDKYLIVFGESKAFHDGTAATQSMVVDCQDDIYLGPGCSLVIHPWSASAASTAAEFFVQVGWIELGHDR